MSQISQKELPGGSIASREKVPEVEEYRNSHFSVHRSASGFVLHQRPIKVNGPVHELVVTSSNQLIQQRLLEYFTKMLKNKMLVHATPSQGGDALWGRRHTEQIQQSGGGVIEHPDEINVVHQDRESSATTVLHRAKHARTLGSGIAEEWTHGATVAEHSKYKSFPSTLSQPRQSSRRLKTADCTQDTIQLSPPGSKA